MSVIEAVTYVGLCQAYHNYITAISIVSSEIFCDAAASDEGERPNSQGAGVQPVCEHH